MYPRENPETWIPDYWIAFLLVGLPAGDNGRAVLGAGPTFAPKPTSNNLLSPEAIKIISNTCNKFYIIINFIQSLYLIDNNNNNNIHM